MRTEIYYYEKDARKAAEDFAKEVGGFVSDRIGCVDDRSQFDYVDRAMRNLCWSGETAAIMVLGGSQDGLFGYWE